MSQSSTLPDAAKKSLEDFLNAGKSGSFTLDIKDGKILGWRANEGRGDRIAKYALR